MHIQRTAFDSELGRQAAALRTRVFVHEQNVPPELELDHYDADATHFVALENGAVVGTLRIVTLRDDHGWSAKIGRVAVEAATRRKGVGRALMRAAIEHARTSGARDCVLTSQTAVLAFYEKLGFTAHGEVCPEAGIPHRAMTLPLNGSIPLAYASPWPLAQAGTLFRHGELLVARTGMTLPDQCILCGRERAAAPPVKLAFTWDSSFRITRQKSTLELRRTGTLFVHLCTYHRRRYRRGFFIGMTGISAGCAMLIASAFFAGYSDLSTDPTYTPIGIAGMLAGFALLIIFLFVYTLRTRTLACTRIDSGYLYLEGANHHFLSSLPPLPPELAVDAVPHL